MPSVEELFGSQKACTIDGAKFVIGTISNMDNEKLVKECESFDSKTNTTKWDAEGYGRRLLVKSIRSWDLTDGDGKVLPISEESVLRLPLRTFYQAVSVATRVNYTSPQEMAAFLKTYFPEEQSETPSSPP